MRIATYKQNGDSALQVKVLKAICGSTEDKTLIDLCCGSAPQTGQLPFQSKTHVDAVYRNLVGGGEMIADDVIDFLKKSFGRKWNISISTDSIEHFRDKDAWEFVELTSKVADKNIWFTPLGEFCMTLDPENNDPDTHKSEWTPEKLETAQPGYWSFLVFPQWHPTLRNSKNEILGAFFFWHSKDADADFERVKNELKSLE